jgi:hypothetical protein
MLTQIIDAGQTPGEVRGRVEGPAVNYIVEVRYNGGDWADLMADMRSWLDRRQIEADEFGHSEVGHGIVVCE